MDNPPTHNTRNLTIAYVGNFEPEWSTENDVRKAWEYLGHQVIPLQENNLNFDILQSYEYDLLLITGTWDDANPLDRMLDIFKGCADRDIPTCTLHLDTFWGTSRGGRHWWLSPMFHTAYIFTADGDYQEKWRMLGKNHIWLPPAVRHDACFKGQIREEYRCDLALVGSNGIGYHEDVWPYRRELVEKLKEIADNHSWVFRNPGGELDKPDAGKISRGNDMNDFYASATVTVGDSLCLSREYSKYWSDRAAEGPGRHGFLIMPYIKALDKMYHGKLPMYKWGDWADLEKQIIRWMDDPLRGIRQDDCAKIAKDEHTYVHRVQKILEMVGY